MTDLDRFAKAAMQGMLAHDDGEGGTNAELAEESYDIAEAMLAESRKRQPDSALCLHGYIRSTCEYCQMEAPRP